MTTTENGQRDELADEIAGHPIGSGYESASVGMDEAREIADAILAAGYRKPRTITTLEELTGLMDGTVIIDGDPICCERIGGQWYVPAGRMPYGDREIILPATVLYEPEAGVGA